MSVERLTKRFHPEVHPEHWPAQYVLDACRADPEWCQEWREQEECKCDCVGDAINKLGEYEDSGMTPEEVAARLQRKHDCKIECLLDQYNEALDALAKYRDAEREGRLHIAPCKDGTVIWVIVEHGFLESVVDDEYMHGLTEYEYGELDKDWFFGRDLAEAALAERNAKREEPK